MFSICICVLASDMLDAVMVLSDMFRLVVAIGNMWLALHSKQDVHLGVARKFEWNAAGLMLVQLMLVWGCPKI